MMHTLWTLGSAVVMFGGGCVLAALPHGAPSWYVVVGGIYAVLSIWLGFLSLVGALSVNFSHAPRSL
jgi:hypothetical protein